MLEIHISIECSPEERSEAGVTSAGFTPASQGLRSVKKEKEKQFNAEYLEARRL